MKKQLITLGVFSFLLIACGGESKMKDTTKEESKMEEVSDSKEEIMKMEEQAAAMDEMAQEIENSSNELDSLIENL